MPNGLALYVRRISKKRHGTPKQFAKKCADNGLKWIALGGLWQELRANGKVTSKMINGADALHRYGDALEAAGVEVYVWGYPWQGHEERFAESMAIAAKWGRVLLDPELGANPKRSRKGVGKVRANIHAEKLVELLAEVDLANGGALTSVGLSTFGSGLRIGWFPMTAFTKALVYHFGDRTFIGGQTYTDDKAIDVSIADMQKVIRAVHGKVIRVDFDAGNRGDGSGAGDGCQVVPNFGLYTWTKDGKRGKRVRGAKAVRKTTAELRLHLYEFVNEGEPVDAMIGWAENFVDRKQWAELARFADMMERGACTL